MTKFYNNVKSRLNKKGINGFTKADYLEAAEQLKIDDLDNVTTEQILSGVELLENRHNSQITAVNNVNTDVNTTESTDAIAPLPDSPLVHHQEPKTLTQQEEVNAIAPLEEDNSEDAIAPLEESNKSSQITLSNAAQLIEEAINNAPADIKQNLLIQYAEREFNSASELLAFKSQIDDEIDNFLANELQRNAKERNEKWQRLQQSVAIKADEEVAKRQDFKSNYLANLQSRIAEFKLSKN